MSIRQGKKLIASSTTNGFNLFDCKWADHILNNISWLRADTFSWQSGDVYVAAYQHLAEEFASVTEWSYETVGGVYIGYKLMPDGHKITDASSEQYVQAIYEATGVAWYYILDTTNRQFKLPRTKWGFTGLRDSVGGYVEAGLPNITGSFSTASDKNLGNGAFSWTTNKYATNGGGQGGQWGINFSAKKSNPIYGNSTTVQPPATQMYLYFYVGNFEQSAIEQTAGLNAEMFNDLNAHKVIEFQAPTSANGYTWYRKYADGWVEQGGRCTVPATNTNTSSSVTVTLPVPIAAPEQATLAYNGMGSTAYFANCEDMASVTTTTVSIGRYNNTAGSTVAVARYYNWSLSGMAA